MGLLINIIAIENDQQIDQRFKQRFIYACAIKNVVFFRILIRVRR